MLKDRVLRRLALTFALAGIYAGLTVAPAQAAFCGVADDVDAIVKLTIATYPKISRPSHTIGESSIRIVDVNGTYAYSVAEEGSARIPFYWEKPTGTWQFVTANHPPTAWSKQIITFFETDNKTLGGPLPSCDNPNWKAQNSR